MSTAPIEFRKHMKRFALDDAYKGIQPVRLTTGPSVNGFAPWALFCPPVDQYRYKERLSIAGQTKTEWSPWIDVPIVLEESPSVPIPPENPPAA